MALDHYISQVHLKKFYTPGQNRMYAIRKHDLKSFTPNAKAVCRLENGNTNKYLKETRAIEEFLKHVEPHYNSVVARFSKDEVDHEGVFVIAGFIAYVLVCSPAAMRLRSAMMRPIIEEMARRLEAAGKIPTAPAVLGGKTLTELLRSGIVKVEVDKKYPQALGITSVLQHINTFGDFDWDILHNPFADTPFFTSDYPIAIEPGDQPWVRNKIVPLTPHLAVRIRPDPSRKGVSTDFSFPQFRYASAVLDKAEVVEINQLIVRCAESTVFFRENHSWVTEFVKANAGFRIESHTERIPRGRGMMLMTSERIRAVDLAVAQDMEN